MGASLPSGLERRPHRFHPDSSWPCVGQQGGVWDSPTACRGRSHLMTCIGAWQGLPASQTPTFPHHGAVLSTEGFCSLPGP